MHFPTSPPGYFEFPHVRMRRFCSPRPRTIATQHRFVGKGLRTMHSGYRYQSRTQLRRQWDHLGIGAKQHPVNSIRLRNLTYLTRHLKESRLKESDQFERGRAWHNALTEARNLQVADIAPELRNEFCALWNELVGVAQDQVQASCMKRSNATRILSLLRTVYIPLHTHTNSALHHLTASTDDHSLILQMGNMYRQCSEPSHQ
ncbi:hypothetical protein EDB89DRAFT_1378399 [Lactarius sanguifluus]|nr:hypothetical protein EDB89DRAFT_1378399 [Lactarius sanguifluus]